MRIPIFQVDAFTARRFGGNPAAVMPLESFCDDSLLQAIALENNLSETAFLVPHGEDWRLRWFTPACEVPLCGHATLASAWVVTQRLDPGRPRVVFHTASGPLVVTAPGDAGYDCVSRYFAPAKGIDEDPVTGGAHCGLTPFWTTRLAKPEIRAYQASARGGEMVCRIQGERVELEGECAFYMEGEVEV
jgi:predicted PhzF superfamily epimerase YddE/YHI9